MIQEFSVDNYLSFGKKQTISFLASADKSLVDDLTIEVKPGVKLLKMAMVYGANASGKSNLLLAIESLWQLMFLFRNEGSAPVAIYRPFELRRGEPTNYEVIFWANGRKYEYSLENNESHILAEQMTYTSDKGVQSLMYKRVKGEPIVFGSTIDIKAKQRDDLNKETLSNHTLFATLNKKNLDVPPAISEVYEWVKSYIHELDIYDNENLIAAEAEKNLLLKNLIIDLLCKADFNISDFKLITTTLPDNILKQVEEDESISNQMREMLLRPKNQIIFTHQAHESNYQISYGMESAGTKAYLRLARLLFDLKENGYIVMKDEIEDSLHYDLLIHYLETFIKSGSRSQLIFTTHNQLLLDESWMIRRDMVWLAEKDRADGCTQLYRVSDMGLHKNVSLLNAYRIGKLGAKPVLGSTILITEPS